MTRDEPDAAPLTAAGRRLVKWARDGVLPGDVALETVLVIEAEVAARFRAAGIDVSTRQAAYDSMLQRKSLAEIDDDDYAMADVIHDAVEAAIRASGSPTDAALRAAAADVRKSHQPNEWDSCVACRHEWPCDAEMLAELVETRALLAASGSPEPVLEPECLCESEFPATCGPECECWHHSEEGEW